MTDWLTSYHAREKLRAIIAELAPSWVLNGAGVSEGGFDISYDIPGNVTLAIEGSSKDDTLALMATLTESEDFTEVEVSPEVSTLFSKIETAWKEVRK
jgi:hypothetical protein